MIRTMIILLFAVLVPFIAIFAPYDFSPLQFLNERVSYKYFKGLYGPTMDQFKLELTPLSHEERKAYIEELKPKFGLPLELKSTEDYKDNPKVYDALFTNEIALDFGDPIALALRLGNSDDVLFLALFPPSELEVLRQAQGPLYMAVQELRRMPKEERDAAVAEQSLRASYTLDLITDDELPSLKNTANLDNEIFSGFTDDGQSILVAKVADNQWLSVHDDSSNKANLQLLSYVLGLFLVLIALTHFFWFYPLWRGLKQLAKTANQFGHGLLTERAKVSKRSLISQLANSFNQMADNIEKLIAGHRELTNAIAHDLRTPLYRLRFAFEMLSSKEVSQEQRDKYTNIIHTSIDDLDNLINQTLQLSRYSRVADINQFSKENLAEQVRTEVEHYQLEHPEIKATFLCHPLLHEQELFIDAKSMLRALKNLLSNAARYAETQVVVSFDRQGGHYVLKVEDDGPGIPAKLRDRVFEPFAQVDNQERQTNKGHGLGLAIVKQIAIWHKGYAQVTDSTYDGAAFEIRWPVYRHNQQEASEEKTSA